jgi:glycosyltransferase involved in cell wall biosynthesis
MRSKGIMDFVHAARKMIAAGYNAEFIIAGEWWGQEPELEDEVKKLIHENDLMDDIKFLGLVNGIEKKKLLMRTDIFVLPTYYKFEGHPNAIIEAMAAGCIIISTDHAAIPETIINGETGFIVPKQDPLRLAETIIHLIEDSKLLREMRTKSYERYKRYYTAERNTKLLVQSLQKALGSHHANRV